MKSIFLSAIFLSLVGQAAVTTKKIKIKCDSNLQVITGSITVDFDTKNWAYSCQD